MMTLAKVVALGIIFPAFGLNDRMENQEWTTAKAEMQGLADGRYVDGFQRRTLSSIFGDGQCRQFTSALFRPFINEGFNGHDLLPIVENVETAESCANICLERLEEGCTAFTWTNTTTRSPNRCIPKTGDLSESDLDFFSEGADGYSLEGYVTGLTLPVISVNTRHHSYRTFVNHDHYGSDLPPNVGDVKSPEDCARICSERAEMGCTGFTWVNTRRNPWRCFPKKGRLEGSHLSALVGAATGFLDRVDTSSTFSYFDNRIFFHNVFLITSESNVDNPSSCGNLCIDRFDQGCSGFSWGAPTNGRPSFCWLLRGALTEVQLLSFSEGSVSGRLEPQCSSGYKVYAGSGVADDRAYVASSSLATEVACREFLDSQGGSFYQYTFATDGTGICKVYGEIFSSSLLVVADFSSIGVPCDPLFCPENGRRTYHRRSVRPSVLAAAGANPVSEYECRTSRFENQRGTFYTFTRGSGGKGACKIYTVPFEESSTVYNNNATTVARCIPGSCQANGLRAYPNRSINPSVLAAAGANPISEYECRTSRLEIHRGTFYTFTRGNGSKGACKIFTVPFEEKFLTVSNNEATTVARCKPGVPP